MRGSVRRLDETDLEAFLAIRRTSLEEAPLVFTSSPHDDFSNAIETARARLSGAGGARIVGAFVAEVLIGIAGIFREPRAKAAHRTHVWGMYVVPGARGRGHGRALLEALVDYARTLPGVAWVELGVTSAAPEARRLYERAGFEAWGEELDALREGGESVSITHLRLRL